MERRRSRHARCRNRPCSLGARRCWVYTPSIQAAGCAPISRAFKQGTDTIQPFANPQTIAKSLSIGTPADGHYAIRTMWKTKGSCEDVTDEEIMQGVRLLAEYEGIFVEPACGVTVACAKKLIENGNIPRDASTVLCITGNGLKTQEAIQGKYESLHTIAPSISAFDNYIGVKGINNSFLHH